MRFIVDQSDTSGACAVHGIRNFRRSFNNKFDQLLTELLTNQQNKFKNVNNNTSVNNWLYGISLTECKQCKNAADSKKNCWQITCTHSKCAPTKKVQQKEEKAFQDGDFAYKVHQYVLLADTPYKNIPYVYHGISMVQFPWNSMEDPWSVP